MGKKNSKYITYVMTFCLIMILFGCKNHNQETKIEIKVLDETDLTAIKENQTEGLQIEKELTIEYVCDKFGIDESEFEGVGFDDFVNFYDLSYETIQNEAVAFLLQRYKDNRGKTKIPNYHEMFNCVDKIALTKENQDDINVVIFQSSIDDSNEFYIFDFQIEKVIISRTDTTISDDEIVGVTNETIKDGIIGLFETYDVYAWRQNEKVAEYTETNEGDTGGTMRWYLKIQFVDGKMYRLYGSTLTDETAPENFDLFVEELKALATSSANE